MHVLDQLPDYSAPGALHTTLCKRLCMPLASDHYHTYCVLTGIELPLHYLSTVPDGIFTC